MLKFYRKNIKIFIWAIVLSFAAWGIGTLTFSRESTSPYAGSIGKEKITQKELMTSLRFYELLTRAERNQQADQKKEGSESKQSAESSPPEPPSYEQLRGLAWQELVVNREALRKHITITDDDVRSEIQRLFSIGGSFNQAVYESWVTNNFRGRSRDFEETVRKYLANQRLREQILKDVPENQRQAKWTEWLISVFTQNEVRDFEQEAEHRKTIEEAKKQLLKVNQPSQTPSVSKNAPEKADLTTPSPS